MFYVISVITRNKVSTEYTLKEKRRISKHITRVVPLYKFQFFKVSITVVKCNLEDDPPSDVSSEDQQQLTATSQCLCHSPHFISLHFIIAHQPEKEDEYNTVGHFERDHSHLNFIIIHCYNCSIIVIVNLLLCLIYKLMFIISMNVQEKTVYFEFSTMHSVRHPPGVLECILHR